MKTLFLIRHGKSGWDDASLSDKERPLKKRGVRDARIMGKVLRKHGIKPQIIVSSPAKRAASTAAIIAEEVGYDKKKVEINKLLYFEGTENILLVIHSLNDKLDTAFIIGHNPDFTELANHFSEKDMDNVPTCGMVGIEFDIKSWSEAEMENGKMFFYDFPSRHR